MPRDVVIAGGHGQVAMRLARLLGAGGVQSRGIIRNPDQAADLEAIGAQPVVLDLEADDDDVAGVLDGAGAIVFAAGSGPGSGPARKQTMDRDGAVKLIRAAQDEPSTGSIRLGERLGRGSVSRDDVAATIAELLASGAGVGRTAELLSGPTQIQDAVAAL